MCDWIDYINTKVGPLHLVSSESTKLSLALTGASYGACIAVNVLVRLFKGVCVRPTQTANCTTLRVVADSVCSI